MPNVATSYDSTTNATTDATAPTTAGRQLDTSAVGLLLGGDGKIANDGRTRAPCPVHGGTGPNLSLRVEADGRLTATCFSERCSLDAIRAAVDRELGTTFSYPGLAGIEHLGPRPAHLGGPVEAPEQVGEAVHVETPTPAPSPPPPGTSRSVPWHGVTAPKPELTPAEKRKRAREKLDDIWSATVPATLDDLVGWYVDQTRCLGLTVIPPALRAHPGLYHRPSGGFAPAMIAEVSDHMGKVVALHRTWLDPRTGDQMFRPSSKMQLGPCAGNAVHLGGDRYAECLLVAEGIETVLAAARLFGIELSPAGSVSVWAAMSTSGLTGLRVPLRFKHVVICGDNDENRAGEVAAEALAARLRRSGVSVNIKLPKRVGEDWNDVLVRRARAPASDNTATINDNQGDAS